VYADSLQHAYKHGLFDGACVMEKHVVQYIRMFFQRLFFELAQLVLASLV
jgi:hypothetical protein